MTAGRQFKNLYGRRWRTARLNYLVQYPFCVYCAQQQRTVSAEHVDHIQPHRGDPALFWNQDNWQSLCAEHHNSTKQRMEKGGRQSIGCDVNGTPLGTMAHWN